MIRNIAIAFILFLNVDGYSQEFYAAYKKSYSAFKIDKNISYTISYVNYDGLKEVSSTTMKVERVDGIVYTEVENMQSYGFDSTSVIINHSDQLIQLNKGVVPFKQNIQNLALIEELSAEAESESKKKVNNQIWYTLHFNDQKFKDITMVVNSKTKVFEKMVYILSEPVHDYQDKNSKPIDRFEIRFENLNNSLEELSNPLNKILRFDGKKFLVMKQYATYQFINNYGL